MRLSLPHSRVPGVWVVNRAHCVFEVCHRAPQSPADSRDLTREGVWREHGEGGRLTRHFVCSAEVVGLQHLVWGHWDDHIQACFCHDCAVLLSGMTDARMDAGNRHRLDAAPGQHEMLPPGHGHDGLCVHWSCHGRGQIGGWRPTCLVHPGVRDKRRVSEIDLFQPRHETAFWCCHNGPVKSQLTDPIKWRNYPLQLNGI